MLHALSEAVSQNEMEIVKKILAVMPSLVNAPNEAGISPLCRVETWQMAHLLISSGGDVNWRDPDENTPIFYTDNRDVILLLLAQKAAVDAFNKEGNTPLMNAVEDGNEILTRHLIVAKANPSLTSPQNRTAADIALENHPELLPILRN